MPVRRGRSTGAVPVRPSARARYARRLSGPLLDRFDVRVEICRPDVSQLLAADPRRRPRRSRHALPRARRAAERGVRVNADLHGKALDAVAPLPTRRPNVLESALRAGRLSGRGVNRVRAVARTIADLRGDVVDAEHVALALSLRAEAFVDRPGGVLMASTRGMGRCARGAAEDGPGAPRRAPPMAPERRRGRTSDRGWLGAAEVGAGGVRPPRRGEWSTAAARRRRGGVAAPRRRASASRRSVLRVPGPARRRHRTTGGAVPPRRSDVIAGHVSRSSAPGDAPLRPRRRVRARTRVGGRRCRHRFGACARHRRRGASARSPRRRRRRSRSSAAGSTSCIRGDLSLWREVERRGVLLGEAPLGAAPERWRFPARNRMIAAIADAVVVVESQRAGGSMHTVTEAERASRPCSPRRPGSQRRVRGHEPTAARRRARRLRRRRRPRRTRLVCVVSPVA